MTPREDPKDDHEEGQIQTTGRKSEGDTKKSRPK